MRHTIRGEKYISSRPPSRPCLAGSSRRCRCGGAASPLPRAGTATGPPALQALPSGHPGAYVCSERKASFWFYTHGIKLARPSPGKRPPTWALWPLGAPPAHGHLQQCPLLSRGAGGTPRPPGRAGFLKSPHASAGVPMKVLGGQAVHLPQARGFQAGPWVGPQS